MLVRGAGESVCQPRQYDGLTMMLVRELIELLQSWPETCAVVVQIRMAEDGSALYEFREVEIENLVRAYDTIRIQLEE